MANALDCGSSLWWFDSTQTPESVLQKKTYLGNDNFLKKKILIGSSPIRAVSYLGP